MGEPTAALKLSMILKHSIFYKCTNMLFIYEINRHYMCFAGNSDR